MKARATAGGIIVTVYVRPSARRDMMIITDGIEIHTREPAEGNRANMAVLKMLSKALNIPRNRVSIVRGATSRVKELHIAGMAPEGLERLAQIGDRK